MANQRTSLIAAAVIGVLAIVGVRFAMSGDGDDDGNRPRGDRT